MTKLKKHLTPTDTEEVRPDFFIRKTNRGYRRVHPIVWNDNYRWKEQLKTVFTFRTFFTLALIIFIAWSYIHDTQQCFTVLEKVNLLCVDNPLLCIIYGFTDDNSGERGVIYEEDTNTIPIHSE